MLHYSLYKNNLVSGNSKDLVGRTANVQTKTQQDLIRDITGPGSILKPTETKASIKNYWGKIIDYLRQGKAYRDEFISIDFSITGYFKHEEDEFDPERNELKINCLLKTTITHVAPEVPLRKVKGSPIVPVMEDIYDWGSETTGTRLTPGDVLEISGTDLKINNNLEGEGVFFISQSGDSEVPATQVRVNEPKTLTLRIPEELTPGKYRLQVRNTRYNGNTLRTSIHSPVLIVE